MKSVFEEKDIDKLVENIKMFKAGAIDAALNRYINKCAAELKREVHKRNANKWWKIWGD